MKPENCCFNWEKENTPPPQLIRSREQDVRSRKFVPDRKKVDARRWALSMQPEHADR